MNAEIFAEWLRKQGYRVARSASSWWYEASPRAWQAFPFHAVIRPSEEELRALLCAQRAVALRCSTPMDAEAGCVSYHAVCEDPAYALDRLDRRTRQNVRAGLASCTVERVPIERLAHEGWALELDTCARQGRVPALDEASWRRRYLAAAELPGFEAWAAIVDGQLAATLLGVRSDDCFELISQQSRTQNAAARVNNALTFTATHELVARPQVRSVFYTLESLDAPPSVDEFKFRMGFAARPVRQRVAFHPWLVPAVNAFGRPLLARLARTRPGTRLAKAGGMLRLHVEGRLPVAAQRWPACLQDRRDALVSEVAAASPRSRMAGGPAPG